MKNQIPSLAPQDFDRNFQFTTRNWDRRLTLSCGSSLALKRQQRLEVSRLHTSKGGYRTTILEFTSSDIGCSQALKSATTCCYFYGTSTRRPDSTQECLSVDCALLTLYTRARRCHLLMFAATTAPQHPRAVRSAYREQPHRWTCLKHCTLDYHWLGS